MTTSSFARFTPQRIFPSDLLYRMLDGSRVPFWWKRAKKTVPLPRTDLCLCKIYWPWLLLRHWVYLFVKVCSAFQKVGMSTSLSNYLSHPLLCEFTASVQRILTPVLSSLCITANGGQRCSFRMQKRLLNPISIRTIKGEGLKAT